MRYVCLFVLAFLLVAPSSASGEQGTIRAELTCGHCTSYSNMVVELTDASRHPVATSAVGQNGVTEFYGLREGAYTFTVRTVDGTTLYQEVVQVASHTTPISVTLPEQRQKARPGSGTISLARLQHKIPKAAKKEYNKADEKMREGNIHESLEHLKKAVEIDPDYMEAHNNLGSRYIMLGDLPNAHAAFKRALELDPHSGLVQVNMGIALLAMGDAKGAETAGRRAVELDPSDLKAKYVLGLALYTQQQFTPETLSLLSKAQERFPNATIALAVVQSNSGHADMARKTLKDYLRSGNKEHKQKAEAMLASLQ